MSSDLVPSITISEFKKLKAHEVKRLKSCEVVSDGEYLFTFINPSTEFIRIRAEYLSLSSNTIGGEDLAEIIRQEPVEA